MRTFFSRLKAGELFLGERETSTRKRGLSLPQTPTLFQHRLGLAALRTRFAHKNHTMAADTVGNAVAFPFLHKKHGLKYDLKSLPKPFGHIKCDLKALLKPFGHIKCDLRVLLKPFGRFKCDLKALLKLFGHIKCGLRVLPNPFGHIKQNFCVLRQSGGGAGRFV